MAMLVETGWSCSRALKARGEAGSLAAGREGQNGVGPQTEGWNPHSLAWLRPWELPQFWAGSGHFYPLSALLPSCLPAKPQRSSGGLCGADGMCYLLPACFTLPMLSGKGLHSVDRECDGCWRAGLQEGCGDPKNPAEGKHCLLLSVTLQST